MTEPYHHLMHMSEQSRVTHVCPRQVFRSRIGSLRKGLKSRLDFEFVQGPFEVTSKGLALPLSLSLIS